MGRLVYGLITLTGKNVNITEVKVDSMMSQVVAEKAPVAERPIQLNNNNNTPKVNTQETAAFEAIRRGLGISGIEHDKDLHLLRRLGDGHVLVR